jgi:hydroxymethylbilane synthase
LSSGNAALRIGTRSSALALWQTERVRTLLAARGHPTERIEIKTTGDLTPNVPLSRIGSRALFTKQIDDALLERRIDLAVHSLKDLPTVLPDGIIVAAVSAREDPRDALVGRGSLRWADLPPGATVATSSLRRRAQLLSARHDLQIADIRGNVDTRLAKLDARTDWHAIVLAAAGLIRLGFAHRIGERLSPEIMLPAPGQGALAVTTRTDDAVIQGLVREAVHDPETAVPVAAERAFLRRLEGGCQVPVAAYARRCEHESGRPTLRLDGRVIALSGESMAEGTEEAVVRDEAQAAEMGTRLAERLLESGAAGILSDVRAAVAPVVTEP